MKTVYKLIFVFGAVALLALLECIICSCNLVAYPVPKPLLLKDNTQKPKKLTLLVYMAADNDLESHAIKNLKALEQAEFSGMNILVLLDRSEGYDETNDNWTDTRLFEVTHDSTNGASIVSKRIDCPPLGISKTSNVELDMGNYNVLRSFVDFAKAKYSAEKYALIIWGHGTGWRSTNLQSRAVAIDDKTNSYMCVKELGLALKNEQLNVIGFDTCFGSIFENLYELKDCAEFITASPGITPASGWNYKQLVKDISDSNFTAEEIAALMAKASSAETSITKTCDIPEMMAGFEEFSQALSGTIIDDASRNSVLEKLLQTKSYSYSQYPCDLYIDIADMANVFYTAATDQDLK